MTDSACPSQSSSSQSSPPPLKLFVGLPMSDGWLHWRLVEMLFQIANDPRCEKQFCFSIRKPCENNRNLLVKKFLEGDCDWLLQIDDDNPPVRNPVDLLFMGKDVIACPTPIWQQEDSMGQPMKHPLHWGTYYESGVRGLVQCKAVSSGCILVHRRVAKAIPAPFLCDWLQDGTVQRGTDIAFCRRAALEGYELWAHYDYPCRHIKEVDLLEVVNYLDVLMAEKITNGTISDPLVDSARSA